jgi:hypothetical protein
MSKRMCGWIGLGSMVMSAAMWGCVLPPPPPAGNNNANTNNSNTNGGGGAMNNAPTANAGADQAVKRGNLVQLDASASADPDGDALSFAWTQVSGPAVVLSSPNAAVTTFAAPAVAGTLVFSVTVSDGKGGTATDTVEVTVEGATGTIIVANNDTGRITIHEVNDLDGEVPPFLRIDAGAQTDLFQVRSVVAFRGGGVVASRQNGGIVFYGDNLNAQGTTPAAAVVDGPNSKLTMPISLALQEDPDLLFVGNVNAMDGILVFDVSDIDPGDIPPVRTFGPPDRAPFTNMPMTVDALWLHEGELYASDTSGTNSNSSRILVFPDAANANGMVTPRIITCTAFGNIEDLIIDENDVLYVVDGTNEVKVFDNITTREGALTPDRVIVIDGTPTPSLQGVALSSDGRGYLADRSNSAVYTITGIATANGVVIPAATLEGFDSRIAGPRQMFVLEYE